MGFTNVRQIPKAKDIIEKMPLSADLKKIKKEKDREIQGVFSGAVDKLLLIIGPCSAHDEDAVCDYISRLAKMQDEVFEKVRAHIRPGMRDFEVMAYAQYMGQLLGSETGYYLGCSARPGTPLGHRTRPQQGRQIQEGALIGFAIQAALLV